MSLKKPAPLGELAGEIRKVGTTPVDSSNQGIHLLISHQLSTFENSQTRLDLFCSIILHSKSFRTRRETYSWDLYINFNFPTLKSLLDYHQGSSYVATSSSFFHIFVPERTLWGIATKLPHHNPQVSDEYLTVPAKQIVI